MEIDKLYYKFKINVKLQEYTRALTFLEPVSHYLEDLTSEDLDLFIDLKKGLLKQYTEQIKTLDNEKNKLSKFVYKSVLEDYSETSRTLSTNTIEIFVNCINNLIFKVKEPSMVGILNIIRAKLFTFISMCNKEEKARYLQQAYYYYKMAVQIAIKDLHVTDINRLKIFHSYCKFLANSIGDYYRSMLFCYNVIEELQKTKMMKEYQSNEFFNSSELENLECKLEQFCKDNMAEYNKVLRIYHPEYKEIM
jgi:hypothetical protein